MKFLLSLYRLLRERQKHLLAQNYEFSGMITELCRTEILNLTVTFYLLYNILKKF